MFKLLYLSLENIVYYKNARLQLDKKGLTVIMGLNKNAVSMSKRRNGAGKTLLISPIANLKHGDPAGSSRRVTKHTMLDNPGSSIEIAFQTDAGVYQIRKFRKGKDVRYQIVHDDVDIEARTNPIAEALIDNLIPFNEDEFFTTVYLDSRRLSALQFGTPTSRQTYLVGLFRLNEFDAVKSLFADQLEDMKDAKAKRGAYQESMGDVLWAKAFDLDAATEELAALRVRHETIKTSLRKLARQAKQRHTFEQFAEQQELAQTYNSRHQRRAEKALAEHRIIEDYELDLADYDDAVAAFAKALARASKILGTEVSARGAYQTVAAAVDKHRDLNRTNNERRRLYDAAQKEVKALEGDLENIKRIKAEMSNVIAVPTHTIKFLEEMIEHLEESLTALEAHTGSDCSMCGGSLTSDKAKARIKALTLQLGEYQIEWEYTKEYEALQSELDEYASISAIRKALKTAQAVQPPEPPVSIKELEGLLNDLHKPECPSKPKGGLPKPAMTADEAEALLKDQAKAKAAMDLVLKHADEIEAGSKIDKSVSRQSRKLEREADQVLSKLVKLEQQVEAATAAQTSYSKLERKVRRIDRSLKNEDVYSVMLEAYGPKGIRLFVMQNIAERIAANLNKFSHLLFPEPFTFQLTIDINVFDILAKRADGRVSDIRALSGAESRAFMMLWMVSILSLIPTARRSNCVFLDEFEAGQDEPTRELMRESFLPMLTSVVPHVIFLTPYQIEPAPGREVYVAVKDGAFTSLVPYEPGL